MAIYHLHVGFVSRSTGRSSVQSAAYICGEKLHEDLRNKTADYRSRAADVATTKTMAPEHSRYKDLSVWNAAENFENDYADRHYKTNKTCENYKSSAQTAMTMVIALPKELADECCRDLVEKFVETRFTSRNLITTYAIHDAEDNPHVHLLISRRAIGENGDFLERKDREICSRSSLLETRKLWADMTNEFLIREGFQERITEKSFADLGINLEATKHQGWYADIIGTDGRIAQENLEISRKNEEKILADPSVILDYLNEKKSVFGQKDILNEISKRVFEEKSISAVFEKVLEEAIYVGESVRGELLYTGKRYQQLESDVLSKFDFFASQEAKTICRGKIISSVLENCDYLSQEQKTAVEGLCGNSNIGVLLGRAGAGKTTTMKAVSDIYKNNGARVIGMSISALASENLGKDAGIESATIASWAHRWRVYENAKEKFLSFDSVVTDGILKQLDWYNDLQRNEQYQLKSGDVIVVDEAGMVGTKEWKTILDAAEKFGAKIIAVGDDNQFKPISAGDCFRHCLRQVANLDQTKFEDLAPIASDVCEHRRYVYELNEIRRQKEEWQREASVEFSKLQVGEALVRYEDHGRVHAIDNEKLYTSIAEKYLEIEKLGSAAVLCSTNEVCAAVNREIRSLKKERGDLGEDIITINGRNFAENDRIMFLKNDRRLGIKNGQCAMVHGNGTGGAKADILAVHLENGEQLEINVEEYSHVDHAYAITLHKSQGRTYDNTVLTVTKQGVMDVKAMYVGMTRHRENVDVYYGKSDFGSFSDFVSSVSKNTFKDSLADYQLENVGNLHKTRVYEYQNLRLELSALLKDVNGGEATWKEYNDLKAPKINLEKEILNNYESCRLYLNQLGITKEKLEESAGLKQRVMTRAERSARNTVLTYVGAVREARELYDKINTENQGSFREHPLYEKFLSIRKIRNDNAREIFNNYPLHREFVNEISKSGEIFICQETIKAHANPSKSKPDAAVQANINVSLYASFVKKVNESQKNLQNEVDIANHRKLMKKKDIYGKRIAENIKMHEQALLKYESRGITKQSIEGQYGKYEEKPTIRALSEAEKVSARNTLMEYVKAAREASALYGQMHESSYNVKKSKDYGKYCAIMERRNTLAEKILLDPSLYGGVMREINALEKTNGGEKYFVSFKKMQKQVDYGKSLSDNGQQTQSRDLLADAKERKIMVNGLISNFAASLSMNRHLLRFSDGNRSTSEVEIFAKLETAKQTERCAFKYTESTFAERMILAKNLPDYKEWVEVHMQRHGYAPHISRPMLVAYCNENDLKLRISGDYVTNEYASMLAHRKISEKSLKESTLEISEAAAKQALCFKALKDAGDIKELTPESIRGLHNKAETISQHLTRENIHVLDDKNFMQLAYKSIGEKGAENIFSETNIQHLMKLNHMDMARQKESPAAEFSLETNKIHNFEIGR